jgi:hypothetical protein
LKASSEHHRQGEEQKTGKMFISQHRRSSDIVDNQIASGSASCRAIGGKAAPSKAQGDASPSDNTPTTF